MNWEELRNVTRQRLSIGIVSPAFAPMIANDGELVREDLDHRGQPMPADAGRIAAHERREFRRTQQTEESRRADLEARLNNLRK